MSKITKFLCILLIANLFVRNLEAAVTVRDVVNGFDENSSRYDKLFQIAQALASKLFYIVRAGIMAQSYQSERDNEAFVQFSQDDFDDFTFQPDTQQRSFDATTKPTTFESKNQQQKENQDSTVLSETPKSPVNDEKSSDAKEPVEKAAEEVSEAINDESIVKKEEPTTMAPSEDTTSAN